MQRIAHAVSIGGHGAQPKATLANGRQVDWFSIRWMACPTHGTILPPGAGLLRRVALLRPGRADPGTARPASADRLCRWLGSETTEYERFN